MATVATTGGSSHASREARRRRILERGSDRLALITGRIQSLPPDQTPADSAQHEDASSNSTLPNQESSREPAQHHDFDEMVEPSLKNIDEGGNITSRSVALHNVKEEISQIPSPMRSPMQLHDVKEEVSQISSSTQGPALNHQREPRHLNSLATGQISSAIAASENIRMCCSVAAAILVILSHIGFPILGFRSVKGIIVFRPLYLLLLTNISIVLGRVMLRTECVEVRTGCLRSVPTGGGNGLVDQLGKALEVGLLLRNIFAALFMDFSIYAVVLISGLSLVRRLGW